MAEGREPTFSLDVRSEGAESLRRIVIEKISQFTGSSPDDTLAEYVVVLVGLGKHREQAIKDLEAFLGDQSEAFVTWLWDHLCSNIHLYTSTLKDIKEGLENSKPVVLDRTQEFVDDDNTVAHPEETSYIQMSAVTHKEERSARPKNDVGSDNNGRPRKDMAVSLVIKERITGSSNRQGRVSAFDLGHGSIRLLKQALSPDFRVQPERNTNEQMQHQKRHVLPPRVNAARRLLQSAVRDAVAPTTCHSKRSEVSLKRLRSIVSTEIEDSENSTVQKPLKELPQSSGARPMKRAVPAMMMALKAAAAAAEDATKARRRLSGSLLDRLGKKSIESSQFKEVAYEHVRRDHGDKEAAESRFVGTSHRGNEQKVRKRLRPGDGRTEEEDSPMEDCTGESSGRSVRGRKRYQMAERHDDEDDACVRSSNYEEGQQGRATERGKQNREESVTVEYRLAQKMQVASKDLCQEKVSGSSSGPSSSQKIVNISVNVNTWKPDQYEKANNVEACELLSGPLQSQDHPGKTGNRNACSVADASDPEREIRVDQATTVALKQVAEPQMDKAFEVMKEVSKFSLPTISGLKQPRSFRDDTEIRTVFVSNIHFAATKEALTSHFAPCGEVARIILITNGVTGQPKGSAYIEFKTIDAAERALGLNESSFMSRALKVVHKDAAIQAIQEANPLVHPALMRRPIPLSMQHPLRGRFLRAASPYFVCRYPTMPPRPYVSFPSLQWKRDTAACGATNATLPTANRPPSGLPSRPTRSLSYIRHSDSLTPAAVESVAMASGLTALPQQEVADLKKDPTSKHKSSTDAEVDIPVSTI